MRTAGPPRVYVCNKNKQESLQGGEGGVRMYPAGGEHVVCIYTYVRMYVCVARRRRLTRGGRGMAEQKTNTRESCKRALPLRNGPCWTKHSLPPHSGGPQEVAPRPLSPATVVILWLELRGEEEEEKGSRKRQLEAVRSILSAPGKLYLGSVFDEKATTL